MSASGWTYAAVEEIEAETDRAFCIHFRHQGKKWIPKSVIADAADYEEGDMDFTIGIMDWFAEKEGVQDESI